MRELHCMCPNVGEGVFSEVGPSIQLSPGPTPGRPSLAE
jgi:hypothetical protein